MRAAQGQEMDRCQSPRRCKGRLTASFAPGLAAPKKATVKTEFTGHSETPCPLAVLSL
jgi:hypothetical protein